MTASQGWLNVLSRCVPRVWQPILRLARCRRLDRLRVLDIATGAGDLPLGLWQVARRRGVTLDIHGVDINPHAVALAASQAALAGAPIEFSVLDVLAQDLPEAFDVVTSSLFLHHIDEDQAVRLLQKMAAVARHLVLVSDLRRSPVGLVMAFLATRLFTRSDVVRTDALRSVRSGFTLEEAIALAERAGLPDAAVTPCWPCRFLLAWERP